MFTDRYDAMGLPSPSLYTMCHGQCEGTGVVPVTSGPITAAGEEDGRG